ncbi:MAG: PP2C family protein-serine/threonine phosphatase [Lentisphaeria bacterium]|nr:PP2C family protein-serine/threonine phosphatase [Lentisphaeria bacterium]
MTWFLAILCFVLITVLVLIYERYKKAKRKLKRVGQDKTDLVDFLNRFTASIAFRKGVDQWVLQVAQFLSETMKAEATFIYTFQDDKNSMKKMVQYGVLPELNSNSSSQAQSMVKCLKASSVTLPNTTGLTAQLFSAHSTLKEDVFPGDNQVVKTLVAVPIRLSHDMLGTIIMLNRKEGEVHFDIDDMFLLETLASQVALGFSVSQMLKKLDKQNRIEQELQLAQQIQSSLLPDKAPEHDFYEMFGAYRSAREVSGDFFDFITISEDLMLAVVADASGKGMPACMLMAMCRSILRSNASHFKEDLEGLMREMNRILYKDTNSSQFITMGLLLLDRHDHTVEYARAGHTPLLIKQPDGQIQVICPDGPALGLLPPELNVSFDSFSFSWLPGMSLMLYSDGLTEAVNHEEIELGLEKLTDIWALAEDIPKKASQHILNSVSAYSNYSDPADDQTVVVLTRPEY